MDTEALKAKITSAVDACLMKAGEYANEAELLDKVAGDILALKEEPGMKGLGEDSEDGMPLDEEMEESGEED
jgi:hypothetical protein